MKKNILMLGLALGLSLGAVNAPTIQTPAFAASIEEKANSIDTTELEYQVSAANYLLENFPNTITPAARTKLRNLVTRAETLIIRANEIKARHKKNDNLHIRVKNQMRGNLDRRNSDFNININSYTTNKQIQDWFLETAKEDWYFFYSMYEKANVATKYNPNKAKEDKFYVDSANFKVTYRESSDVEKRVEEFADKWIAQNINITDSDYDKTLKIHDFIVTANQYNRGDSNARSGGYSIYHPASILYGNGGVCNAYATLFDKLGTKAGLDVRYATGFSKKTGEPHIWNMVKIDGVWYNIDATWDDPTITFNEGDVTNLGDFVIYDYFLKSDDEFKKSRTIDEDQNKPVSVNNKHTGLKNSVIQLVGGEYRVVR